MCQGPNPLKGSPKRLFMVNNYSSDPNNAAPIGQFVKPQNDPRGSLPETPYTPHTPGIEYAATRSSTASEEQNGGYGNSAGPHRLTANTVLSGGRYKIERLVASGGMGAVYCAIDMRFNRPCAVKEMLNSFSNEAERAQAVEWFSREATLLLDLNHPCIPRVRDFFVEGGRHYLVMDLIVGKTLGDVLEKEGNIVGQNGARGVAEARARSWMQQVSSVLGYLHRQNPPIIFRDLKPS